MNLGLGQVAASSQPSLAMFSSCSELWQGARWLSSLARGALRRNPQRLQDQRPSTPSLKALKGAFVPSHIPGGHRDLLPDRGHSEGLTLRATQAHELASKESVKVLLMASLTPSPGRCRAVPRASAAHVTGLGSPPPQVHPPGLLTDTFVLMVTDLACCGNSHKLSDECRLTFCSR